MPQAPSLPFSKTRRVGELVFLSGELPLVPDGAMPAGIEAQTALTLERIAATLQSEGLGLNDVVSVTAYLVNAADFAGFNRVYADYFGFEGPARNTVAVKELPHPHQGIMITAIAFKPGSHIAPDE